MANQDEIKKKGEEMADDARDKAEEIKRQAEEAGKSLQDKASEVAERAQSELESRQDKASQMAERAHSEIEARREEAASKTHAAADVVRDKSGNLGGFGGKAGARVASALDSTADTIESASPSKAVNRATGYAKQHPGIAIVVLLVGLLLLRKILH